MKDAAQVALIAGVGVVRVRRRCQRRYEQVRPEARNFGGNHQRLDTGATLYGSTRFGYRRRVVVLLLSRSVATTTLGPRRSGRSCPLFRRLAMIATRQANRATPSARQREQKAAQESQGPSQQAHESDARQNGREKQAETARR